MHLGQHFVGSNEVVGDPHSMGLHGVTQAIGVRPDVGWQSIEKGDTKNIRRH